METRQRGTRLREDESRLGTSRELSATRSMRPKAGQNASAAASNTSSTSRASLVDSGSNNSNRGSLSRDVAARRGAKISQAHSVASIPFSRGAGSDGEDEDEFGDGEEDEGQYEAEGENGDGGEEEQSPAQTPPISDPQDGDGSEADEDDMRQTLLAGLPDLERAADEFMIRLLNGNYDDKGFRAILNVKKRAFVHHRDSCLEPDAPSPFIDWALLQDLKRSAEQQESDANILARANLVSALNYIQETRAGGGADALELLQTLDSVVPTLVSPSDRARPPAKLAVYVRACYAVELLAMANSRADLTRAVLRQVIKKVFCKSTDGADFDILISHGPFRSLGYPEGDEDLDLCSKTAIAVYKGGRTKDGVEPLRQMFPLDKLLDKLEEWIRNEYSSLQGPDDGDSASNPESQPVVFDTNYGESLFVDAQSRRQLEATSSRTKAPPSNQQQAVRNSTGLFAAGGEPFSSSTELLRENTPASNSRGGIPPRSGAKRAYVTIVESDGEDADPFETDDRPVDNSKRAAIQSGIPSRKHARYSAPDPQTRAVATLSQARAAPSAQAPAARHSLLQTPRHPSPRHPSTASAAPASSAPAGPVSSQADLAAVRLKAAETSAAARMQQRGYRGATQTRIAWSDSDSRLLIELIYETNASWAIIEKNHNSRFEYPRNQQAYRDKARNLKVDFLSADTVLPPGFDHVVLGAKEIIKVRQKGKNHMRQELDIDNRGIPIYTEADDAHGR